jgi:hypothetical protein
MHMIFLIVVLAWAWARASALEIITDNNILYAVSQWMTNSTAAELKYGKIILWNTSRVTDMSMLFKNRATFNANLSLWDTTSVTSMQEMFCDAQSFNHNLGLWNVAKVKSLIRMFADASNFNQNISSWTTSAVTSARWASVVIWLRLVSVFLCIPRAVTTLMHSDPCSDCLASPNSPLDPRHVRKLCRT